MNDLKCKFEIIEDHASGDFVFDAYGLTLSELFETCAIAAFGVVTDLGRVEPLIERVIELTADDANDLLFSFISELIYLKDVEHIFFCEVNINIAADNKSLDAIVKGERIDFEKHIIKTDIKAVTYHDLNIISDGPYYKTRMILDL
jgi:SHS2 domain-containing protein